MGLVKCIETTRQYSQEGDCCDGEAQFLTIQTQDGGGGNYVIIKTERWALDEKGIEEFYYHLKHILKETQSFFED